MTAEPAATIREATAADVDRLLELQSLCFGAEAWTRGMIEEELRRPGSIFLVADDPIKGFACAWAVLDELHLLQIAVHPGSRRGGLASRLHAALVAAARRVAAAGWLEVRADNPGAIAFYAGLGWEAVGKRPKYYADGCDAFVYRLPTIS